MNDTASPRLNVSVPGESHHRELVACQAACPVHTDARGYVRAVAAGRFEEAYLIARGPNPFASICGRVCGAPCETACRRGKIPRTDADGRFVALDRPVSIRALKRFACEQAGPDVRDPGDVWKALQAHTPETCSDAEEMAATLRAFAGRIPKVNGDSVGIIGGGPAGLSAAHDLALMGFKPVVYDIEKVPGGMLAVGIPAYRLPRALIQREIAVIQALGVEIRCGVTVGKDVSFAELRRRHRAILLCVGAKRSRGLGLPGEAGPGVFGGVDFLRAVSVGEPLAIGSDVLVIGGGNVAYDVARTVLRNLATDAARTAIRLPGTRKVRLASLETLEEMPADTVEIREGDEEGVERLNGWGPVEILRGADGRITGVTFRKCLRVFDADRKFAPVYDEARRQTVACDTVLLATGQAADLSFLQDGGTDVQQARPGWPTVDRETLQSTAAGVFVAGDLAHGPRLLIDAVASGKKAARSIYSHLTGRRLEVEVRTDFVTQERYTREHGYESIRRVEIPTADPHERMGGVDVPVEKGYTEEQARREASRCLDCGVTPVFDGSRCVLCGGCADVCPTLCLKLVPLSAMGPSEWLEAAVEDALGGGADAEGNSAILKDEDRCIRCALCARRCPVEAIAMDRVQFTVDWRIA
ncbi:MAG: FAD-dependent oxidoreductase [Candidatus Brocadiae bacterium]|nr:FAD-dependent oxidoreductase [Candidatus Brocadiia bacterium]